MAAILSRPQYVNLSWQIRGLVLDSIESIINNKPRGGRMTSILHEDMAIVDGPKPRGRRMTSIVHEDINSHLVSMLHDANIFKMLYYEK